MNSKFYPKVLLLGEPFNDYTGMGVTLTNLLKDWPKEKIAVASYNLDPELCEKIRPCCRYVTLGQSLPRQTSNNSHKVGWRSRFRKLVKCIYNAFGISDLRHIPVTSEIIDCIQTFKPDIIINALGSLDRIKFCGEVMKYAPESKLALYVVDDWPNTKFIGRFAEWIWRKVYDRQYRKIIKRADVCMSICPAMSEAYMQQYGVKFHPFHNPINVQFWDSVEKEEPKTDEWRVAYVGKINRETRKPLEELCSVMDELNAQKNKLTLDIYTPNAASNHSLSEFRCCNLKEQVSNEQIPKLLKNYDILFLTLGFSDISRKYARLSMPTKLTEYLISGVPILLYCPSELALSQYVKSYDSAIVCNQEDKQHLKDALLTIVNDEERRKQIVDNARRQALQHDVKIVRETFRQVLVSSLDS